MSLSDYKILSSCKSTKLFSDASKKQIIFHYSNYSCKSICQI